MAVAFAPGSALFNVTPVENLFIEINMKEVPGDFVKVYLYGLMLCYNPGIVCRGVEDMALAVGLSPEQVQAALAAWEEKKVLRVLSKEPLEVEYYNIEQSYHSTHPVDTTPMVDEEFAGLCEQINEYFSGKRVLTHNEIKYMRSWRDELGFDCGAISLLIQFCREEKGSRVSFKYIDAVMQERARNGEVTMAEVDAYLRRRELGKSGAAQILARWNIRRTPSEDELSLYRKWTESWGMEYGVVAAACAQLTWAAYPSFALLDQELQELHAHGVTSAREAAGFYNDQDSLNAALKEVGEELGLRSTAIYKGMFPEAYRYGLGQGYSHEIMRMAAAYLKRKGLASARQFAALLEQWQAAGIREINAVQQWLSAQDEAYAGAAKWLRSWGLTRAPGENEINAYEVVTRRWALPQALVEKAVEDAVSAQHPMRYMLWMLKRCHEQRIETPEGYLQLRESKPAGKGKEYNLENYTNVHEYTRQDFADDYTDIFSDEAMP